MVKRAFGYAPCTVAEKADARKWIAKRSIAIIAALLVTAGVITGAAVVIKKMSDRHKLGGSGKPPSTNDDDQGFSITDIDQDHSIDDDSRALLKELKQNKVSLRFYDNNLIINDNGDVYAISNPIIIVPNKANNITINHLDYPSNYHVSAIRKIEPLDTSGKKYSGRIEGNKVTIDDGQELAQYTIVPRDYENSIKPSTRVVSFKTKLMLTEGIPLYGTQLIDIGSKKVIEH